MQYFHRPSEDEIMAEAWRVLKERGQQAAGRSGSTSSLPSAIRAPVSANVRPHAFEKPAYGTPAYGIARHVGWITDDEDDADRAAREERRLRSLQTCHYPSLYEGKRFAPPRDSGAYVPELSARLDDDRNVTDGARRCGRKIAEETYRRNREGRSLEVTVTYLMKALGRCRRTVQRYLRVLEREGYIRVDVVSSDRTRMCAGLVVHLLAPLLARHHRSGWPATGRNPDATRESQNKRFKISLKRIPREQWAVRCMNGVFRSLTKALSPATSFFSPIS
jgi:hypothetical protein